MASGRNVRGETHRDEQECVYYKQRFTISEFVISEDCLVTPKNMFGAEKTPVNETYHDRGRSKSRFTVLMQKGSCYLVEWG